MYSPRQGESNGCKDITVENVQISSKHLVLSVSRRWYDNSPGSPFYVVGASVILSHYTELDSSLEIALSNPVKMKLFLPIVEIWGSGLKEFPVMEEAKLGASCQICLFVWTDTLVLTLACLKNCDLSFPK